MPIIRGKIKWFSIDWRKATSQVKRCQVDIAVAYKEGNMTKVKVLQDKLVNSFSRKRFAVKAVFSNKGKNTPEINAIVWNKPEEKYQAIMDLKPNETYKAKPVKCVYIPKVSGKL